MGAALARKAFEDEADRRAAAARTHPTRLVNAHKFALRVSNWRAHDRENSSPFDVNTLLGLSEFYTAP